MLESRIRSRGRTWAIWACLVLSGLTIDQVSKVLVFRYVGEPQPGAISQEGLALIPQWLYLTPHYNTGALFGIGQGMAYFFAATAILALGGIVYLIAVRLSPRDDLSLGALGLVAGGTLGNTIDRIVFGGVRNFIQIGSGANTFPIFTYADVLVNCGAWLLVWRAFRER